MKKSKKVIGYVRTNVTGPEGNEKIKNQINSLYSYSTENNFEIAQIFCDTGISGLQIGPEMERLIKLCDLNFLYGKTILIDTISTLGRSYDNIFVIRCKLFCNDIHVEVVTKTNGELDSLNNLFVQVLHKNNQRKS